MHISPGSSTPQPSKRCTPLRADEWPIWKAEVPMYAWHNKVEYKYVKLDKESHHIRLWEDLNNRSLSETIPLKPSLLSLSLALYSFSSPSATSNPAHSFYIHTYLLLPVKCAYLCPYILLCIFVSLSM